MFPMVYIPKMLAFVTPFLMMLTSGPVEDLDAIRVVPDFEYYSRATGIHESVNRSCFAQPNNNSNGNLIIYIHGLNADNLEIGRDIKNVLLYKRKYVDGVILVDWTIFSDVKNYVNIIESHGSQVAERVSAEISRFLESSNLTSSDIGIVGHGMGAHVAGQAARILKGSGNELGFIIGLDPENLKPSKNTDFLLRSDDASSVLTLHSDDLLSTDIGTSAQNVHLNSGPIISTCYNELNFWNDHYCRHRAAIQVFKSSLEKPGSFLDPNLYLDKNDLPAQPSSLNILLLDVSPGMQKKRRIQDAIQISKRIIKTIPQNAFVGIILFGGYADARHPPLKIQDETSRQTLIQHLPTKTTTIFGKSIGSALKAALGMAAPFLKTGSCPQITLLTNGEEPFSSLPMIMPNLTSTCTKVHSISMASSEAEHEVLRNLSSATLGHMADFNNVKELSALVQTIFDLSSRQTAPRLRQVEVFKKEIPLDNLLKQKFIIDAGIGRNTCIKISGPNFEQIGAQITDPQGNAIPSNSSHIDTDLESLIFQIPEAAPGEWFIELTSNNIENSEASNVEMSISVTSMANNDKDEENLIRLEAKLSDRILNYTNRSPITVQAQLTRGNQARIIGAHVKAFIQSSLGEEIVTMQLRDDGLGADAIKNDGKYSAYITEPLSEESRYTVFVEATNSNFARIRQITEDDLYLTKPFSRLPVAPSFERRVTAGWIQVVGEFQRLFHSRVRDLKIRRIRELEFKASSPIKCELKWTAAVGDESDNGTVSSFQIEGRSIPNRNAEFEYRVDMNSSDVKAGILDVLPAGELQSVTIEIPENLLTSIRPKQAELGLPEQLYLSVKSFNSDGEVPGASNIVVLDIRQPVGMSSYFGLRIIIAIVFVIFCFVVFNFTRRFRQQFVYSPVRVTKV